MMKFLLSRKAQGPSRIASKLDSRHQQVLEAVTMVAQHFGALRNDSHVRLLRESEDSGYYVVFEMSHLDVATVKANPTIEQVFKHHLKNIFDITVEQIIFANREVTPVQREQSLNTVQLLRRQLESLRREEIAKERVFAESQRGFLPSGSDLVNDSGPVELETQRKRS